MALPILSMSFSFLLAAQLQLTKLHLLLQRLGDNAINTSQYRRLLRASPVIVTANEYNPPT